MYTLGSRETEDHFENTFDAMPVDLSSAKPIFRPVYLRVDSVWAIELNSGKITNRIGAKHSTGKELPSWHVIVS